MAEREEKSPTAESLLRPHWLELIARLDPLPVADELYQRQILSRFNMELIRNSTSRARCEGARELLYIMVRHPWEDAVVMARIVSAMHGIRDLGERILFQAGIVVYIRLLTKIHDY